MTGAPDLTNLPWFLAHLGDRDAGAAALARQLLDDGWEVEGFWGPVQMDVWSLTVRRGRRVVQFGVERGYSDGVVVGDVDAERAGYRPLSFAVLGWARSCGVDVVLDDPDRFCPDLAAFGRAAIDWLDAGNDDVHARIVAAARAERTRRRGEGRRLDDEGMAEARARGIREIEESAAPPTA